MAALLIPGILMALLCNVDSQADLICDEGWQKFAVNCFRFFTDFPMTSSSAMESCHIHGSTLAYARDNSELSYLMRQVQNRTVYSWKVGYRTKSFQGVTTISVPGFDNKWQDVNSSVVFPPIQIKTDETLKCVVYHSKFSHSTFSREPCKVLLPYICTGDAKNAKGANYSSVHWNLDSGVAYYISGTKEALSNNDAQHSCTDKGLSLMVLSNVTDKPLYRLTQNWKHQDTWWCGLTGGVNSYRWSDNTLVDKILISFKPESTVGYVYWMMMSTGAVRPDPKTYTNTRPYICKKAAFSKSNFKCPVSWYRGGQSCYYVSKDLQFTQTDATSKCKEVGAHLLSINSKDESLWFEMSTILRTAYSGAWTSLNDIDSENNFVWNDGSKYDSSLVEWKNPLSRAGGMKHYFQMISEGRACAACDPKSKDIFIQNCENHLPIGCQYTLEGNGDSCVSNWREFQGICYKTDISFTNSQTWSTNLVACFSSLADIDPTISPEYIKVDNVQLLDFFNESMVSWFWTGLSTVSTPGVFRWTDGSLPDYSYFSITPEPDNGGSIGNQDCVLIHDGAIFEDIECSVKQRFVCEKEISYVSSEDENEPNGCDSANVSLTVVMTFTLLCSSFLQKYHW